MKRWPKHIVLPVALALYFVAMAVFGVYRNGWQLPDNFLVVVLVETAVIVLLYFLLKKRRDMKGY